MSSFKVENLVKGPKGEFRWRSNNAVVPPQWLHDEGIQFDAPLQYEEFWAMAERFNNWWNRMPQPSSTEEDKLMMFADQALGRLVLRPAIGEKT